jgi:imidazolonepropionase-like amidohydrolase
MVAREARLLHEHGLDAMAAIVAATAGAARLLDVDDLSGTVEPGARADLLLVDGDPLTDLERLGRPTMVVQGGRVVVDRTASWGVLGIAAP